MSAVHVHDEQSKDQPDMEVTTREDTDARASRSHERWVSELQLNSI
jgi:hypothetical protein